jgi:HAD superfamily hydrolase (TIGR01509 family)
VIRTFLFDMGNVLVHFSHDRMCRQIGALCRRSGYELRERLMVSGRQWDFERGMVTPDQFHTWFEVTFKTKVERSVLAHAASDIFTLNSPMVNVLEELKSRGYRLVLLSNTSAFHFEFVRSHFPILDCFDDFILSYEVQAMKPESAIYEAALKRIGCDAPDCFYTDDIPHYVEMGRRHGLDAEVFTSADALQQQLALRGIHLRGGVIV